MQDDADWTERMMRAFADAWKAEIAKGAKDTDIYRMQVTRADDGSPVVRLTPVSELNK
jgi:hypothetical protein